MFSFWSGIFSEAHHRGYFSAALLFAAASTAVWAFNSVALRRLKAWAEKTNTTLDNFLIHVLEHSLLPLLYFGALQLSLQGVALPQAISKTLSTVGSLIVTVAGIRAAIQILNYFILTHWLKNEEDPGQKQLVKGILPIVKTVVWLIGLVFLLDNLGYKVSTLVAGLGIGGVAVALAAQTILGDLFSYFAILFDRPFVIGDFIIVGDVKGTIEHIGIKTTRLISLSGEQLVLSNADLTGSRIRNYKRMQERRVAFKLGVAYETDSSKIKEIPDRLSAIIKKEKLARLDRSHFSDYGDFSLNFETVYFVLTSDYNTYMDLHQRILLAIADEFKKMGVSFAYPTQTIYLNKIAGTH